MPSARGHRAGTARPVLLASSKNLAGFSPHSAPLALLAQKECSTQVVVAVILGSACLARLARSKQYLASGTRRVRLVSLARRACTATAVQDSAKGNASPARMDSSSRYQVATAQRAHRAQLVAGGWFRAAAKAKMGPRAHHRPQGNSRVLLVRGIHPLLHAKHAPRVCNAKAVATTIQGHVSSVPLARLKPNRARAADGMKNASRSRRVLWGITAQK